jgi:glycosyltransferase involved in cell wall biosynthesis
MPLFSVIIPTYNRAALLQAALESVFAQEFRDFEVLVVDDGSTDETETVVNGFGSRPQYLRQQNNGPGAARNFGIQAAQGTYVTFLDSDDLWFRWTLAAYAEAIRRENNPAWIMGKPFRFQSPDELRDCQPETLRHRSYPDYLASSVADVWVPGCGVAIRRDVLQPVRGFTNQWINAEDSDLWLRLGEAKTFIVVDAPATLAYRCHPSSAVANLQKTWEGMTHLLDQEKAGRYPGGHARKMERWRILCRHTRAGSKDMLRSGRKTEAWKLYRQTFVWNVRLGNWKYLIGFGALLVFKSGRKKLVASAPVEGKKYT